ncbi:SH3 domain-containing kinase-binding protein 1 isoform X2 [Thrips palmi]|uniref:SH3 domain-containing kinase-binding protein 1 isoform X2 n=1 Tax=Thrips palmi TaxID=161013 RepID=A0A6P8ZBI0_THRPL|nr:SH3 domain-containing kinase-binding protein 1 isoform X2 [Thrips palmi]
MCYRLSVILGGCFARCGKEGKRRVHALRARAFAKARVEAVVEFDYSAQEVDELSIHKGDVITDIRTQPGGWWEGCLHGRRGMFPDNFVKIRSKANGTSTKETMANNEVQLRGGSARRCKVLFSYQPANDDELELQINDVIDVLDEVEEGWWRGKLRNRVGVFPSNFVTEITEKQTNGGPGSRKTSATQPPPLSMIRKEEVSGDKMKGVIISETDSPASPTGPDSGNPNALDVDCNAPVLPPKPVKELCRVLYQYEAANEDELTLKEGDIVTIVTKDVQDKGWWKGELRGHTGLFPDNFVVLLPPEESPQARKPERPPPAKTTTSISTRGDISKVPTAKKSLDNSKPDEKAPPVLSKKPVLPPASKKPQLRNAAPAVSPPVNTVTAPKKGDADFDGVERGAMLTHPTASRAKAPRRRLPTAMLNKDAEPVGGMLNGNSDHHNHSNENNVSLEETDKENGFDINSSASSGTSSNRNSKEWEKNKAPWMEELKMSQAAKKGIKSPAAPSPPKPETARSKKDIPDSPASPTSPEPPKPNTVTVRQHSTANNIASSAPNHPPSATVSSRPQSVHSEVPATRLSGPGNRPVSMYSTANDKLSTPPSNSVPPDATVPMKQFLELVEKVKKLENHCEFLKRTVTELSLQLNEEKEKRFQMQQEIVKLTDLVTQV